MYGGSAALNPLGAGALYAAGHGEGEIVRGIPYKNYNNILKAKQIKFGCYYLCFGDDKYLCRNSNMGGAVCKNIQVVTSSLFLKYLIKNIVYLHFI